MGGAFRTVPLACKRRGGAFRAVPLACKRRGGAFRTDHKPGGWRMISPTEDA
jgi:hypothetical protein